MNTLDDFIAFAQNSKVVIAKYESLLGQLEAMVEIKKTDDCPLLRKWIADAHRRLEALRPMYDMALTSSTLPLTEIAAIWRELKALRES